MLALGSLSALQRELREQGIITRVRAKASGQRCGGVPLTNGPLQYMLRNRTYLGELNHKEQSYPGEHDAIIDATLLDAVQARLDHNRVERHRSRFKSAALLLGLMVDDRGHRMTPSHAVKNGARYRYYVSCLVAQGRKTEAGTVARVAAHAVETIVSDALTALIPTQLHDPQATAQERIASWVERATVRPTTIEIRLRDAVAPPGTANPILVPWSARSSRRRREIVGVSDRTASRPIRAEARSKLLARIAQARGWVEAIMAGTVSDIEAIAAREAISLRGARMTLSLAFLAPDIVAAAANAILPRGFGLSRLTDLPMRWDEQRRKLGLVEPASIANG